MQVGKVRSSAGLAPGWWRQRRCLRYTGGVHTGGDRHVKTLWLKFCCRAVAILFRAGRFRAGDKAQ